MSCRKQRTVLMVFLLFISMSAFGAVKITSIDFKGTVDPNELNIRATGPLTFEKTDDVDGCHGGRHVGRKKKRQRSRARTIIVYPICLLLFVL